MTTNIELPGHFLNHSGFLRADQRTKQRNLTFKFGVITFGSDRRLCVVKNISPTGAMIELENTTEIPDEFTLAIEADAFTRVCRIAWKKPEQIAVNFDSSRRDVGVVRDERRQTPRRIVNAPRGFDWMAALPQGSARSLTFPARAFASRCRSRQEFLRRLRSCSQSMLKDIASVRCGDAPTR
jgi:hypothetical protein